MSVSAWVLLGTLSILILFVTGLVAAVRICLELTLDEQAERASQEGAAGVFAAIRARQTGWHRWGRLDLSGRSRSEP